MTKTLITPAPVRTICETNPESPDPDSPIWLLGDSPSAKFKRENLMPLDPRHPTRHTIWTPILNVVQRVLFFKCGCRLDDSKLYIRNAVSDSAHKGNKEKCEADIAVLRDLLNRPHRPLLVLCFGQFAFDCALRAQKKQEKEERWPPRLLKVVELSQEFRKAISAVQLDSVTLLPLLHQVVARKFGYCHKSFSGKCGNYFEYTGQEIAKVLIDYRTHPRLNKLLLRANRDSYPAQDEPEGDVRSALIEMAADDTTACSTPATRFSTY